MFDVSLTNMNNKVINEILRLYISGALRYPNNPTSKNTTKERDIVVIISNIMLLYVHEFCVILCVMWCCVL